MQSDQSPHRALCGQPRSQSSFRQRVKTDLNLCWTHMHHVWNEPVQDKTYKKTCVTSKDQPVNPPGMARFLIYPSFDSQEAVKDTCHQPRLWSDCMDKQADLSSLVTQVLLYRCCQAWLQCFVLSQMILFHILPKLILVKFVTGILVGKIWGHWIWFKTF